MQTLGYIFDKETSKKLLVLARQSKYGVHLKIRKTGEDGSHFSGEEVHLNEHCPDKLKELKNGESIYC